MENEIFYYGDSDFEHAIPLKDVRSWRILP